MAIKSVERHEAFIYDKGGVDRLYPIKDINSIKWTRVRDDISEASLSLTNRAGTRQLGMLNNVMPGRHELVIFREGDRVWEGPLNLCRFTKSGVEFGAKDPSYYLKRIIMRAAYSSAYPNIETVMSRLERIIRAEASRREGETPSINLLSFLTTHNFSTDAKTSAKTLRYQMYVWEHLDNMAQRNGIDYTTIGRALHIWDTSRPVFGETPKMSDLDFNDELAVTLYGAELATYAAVTDGQGHHRAAKSDQSYYGLIEQLYTAYDEENGGPLPTSADLVNQARRNLAGRNPTPAKISVPENVGINMRGSFQFQHLIPGIYIPLVANFHLKRVEQMQKLNTVTVSESSQEETIAVSMTPASASDEADTTEDAS